MQYKSKYTGAEIDSILDKANAGSGIAIVDSVDQLDPSAELGSLASVIEPGSIKESSVRDLYQPDASIIDQESGVLTAPELLSSVLSVSVLVPQNVDSLVESMVYLVTRDFSMTSLNMAMIQIVPQQGVAAVTITGGYDTYQQFVLAEYSQDTMSYTIHNDQVEAFNAILANSMDWCYFGDPEGGVITEEQFATIDLFIRVVAGIPSKAHVYLKKDSWEELHAKDFLNINTQLKSARQAVDAKADKIKKEPYSWTSPFYPNVYYGNITDSNWATNVTHKFRLATPNPDEYSEYMFCLTCSPKSYQAQYDVVFVDQDDNPLPIKWQNNIVPVFQSGYIYVISIVDNLGVFAQYINS